jgi:hypothetical protein
MRKVSQEDLDALNFLVQDGLIEVVSIDEFGEPSYRLASEFIAEHNARTGGSSGVRGSAPGSGAAPRGPGQRPGVQARCASGPSPLALPVSVGRPRQDAAGVVKGAEGERSDPLTASTMLPPRPTEGVPHSRLGAPVTRRIRARSFRAAWHRGPAGDGRARGDAGRWSVIGRPAH